MVGNRFPTALPPVWNVPFRRNPEFTDREQVLARLAQQLGIEDALRTALAKMAIASVGPTTSEMLRDHELPVDIEPEHPKMGPLVAALMRHIDVHGPRSSARDRAVISN